MSDTRAEPQAAQVPAPGDAEGSAAGALQADAWRSDPLLPRYVRKCGTATLVLFNPATGEHAAVPCICGSWKCPNCAAQRNRKDARRLSQALLDHNPSEFLFIVATFARRDSAARESRPAVVGWRDKRAAFEALSGCWDAVRRELGPVYGTPCPAGAAAARSRVRRSRRTLRYAATVEQHKDGFPHLNVLLHAPQLAQRVREGEGAAVLAELLPVFVRAGFGYQLHIDAVDAQRGDLAHYLIKQAPCAGNMDHELLKATQLPVDGGWHFRRLRSSRGFLPPAPESEWTAVRVPMPVERVQLELERYGLERFMPPYQAGREPAPVPIRSVLASQWTLDGENLDGARSGAERRTAFRPQVRWIGTTAPDERLFAFVAPSARAARRERPEAEWSGALTPAELERFLENCGSRTLSRREESAARTASDLARFGRAVAVWSAPAPDPSSLGAGCGGAQPPLGRALGARGSEGARAAGAGGAERPLNPLTDKSEPNRSRELLCAGRSGAPPAFAPRA